MSKAKRKRKERNVETYVNIDYAELNLMKDEVQVLDHRTNRLSKRVDLIEELLADLKKKFDFCVIGIIITFPIIIFSIIWNYIANFY